jgi:3'-phosphoadenosine 5'-phosphosulfate sulfotransferase (PAPS reductase)/FAD synthetase
MSNNIYLVSGGKDSTAMLLHALENGDPVDSALFLDTTLEFPELYTYLDKLDAYIADYGIKIERRVTSSTPFDERFYRVRERGQLKGTVLGFPYAAFPRNCWIRREFKAFPKPGDDDCHMIGIAYDERHRTNRKMYSEEVECVGCAPFADHCNTLALQVSKYYKFPLITWKWTEAECIKYLEERDMLNPLYDRFKRIGCWLCVYQRKDSLYNLYTHYPELWGQLLKYESDSPHGFKPMITLTEMQDEFDKRNAVKQLTLV